MQLVSMCVKLNVTCNDWDWGLGTGDWENPDTFIYAHLLINAYGIPN